MQLHNSEFRSVVTCARTVFKNEGLAAFYISYPTTLTMTVPFTAAQFSVYEYVKRILNPRNEYSPVSHIVAGGVAGGVAAAITTPLDVAKTMLQTRGTSSDKEIRTARGMMDALRIIYRREGLKGFGRGMSPRVLTFMPSNALCWLSYEFFSACIYPPCKLATNFYVVSQKLQLGNNSLFSTLLDSRRVLTLLLSRLLCLTILRPLHTQITSAIHVFTHVSYILFCL